MSNLMKGIEFELIIATLFEELGDSVSLTKSSGDQGIDLIVAKGNEKIGIQAKRYSSAVSNKAIQEAVAGYR